MRVRYNGVTVYKCTECVGGSEIVNSKQQPRFKKPSWRLQSCIKMSISRTPSINSNSNNINNNNNNNDDMVLTPGASNCDIRYNESGSKPKLILTPVQSRFIGKRHPLNDIKAR